MGKNGFTLAEVLITLGIIGVVAAMTIPTLIANTRADQLKSRYFQILFYNYPSVEINAS